MVQTLVWRIGKKDPQWLLVVPIGKEFESSVQKAFAWALSPDDPYFLKAAAVHDTLLEQGCRRAFADNQWFEAALSDGAPVFKTWIAYSLMRARRFWRWALKLQDGQLRA